MPNDFHTALINLFLQARIGRRFVNQIARMSNGGTARRDIPGPDDTVPDRSSEDDGMVPILDIGAVLTAHAFQSGDLTRWSAKTQ